ncbi:hypothetical protein A3B32_02970 [Candidatus Uhrbacteria bacterium RIFCSPLOWO2_01_FULL_53_9]|uniref:Uncharacterized protein n=2 Tax=Candidatus Uhriibacteriota TaxID=1752732 RepID=A0A1F7UYX7_9BACT|nr:MAG: hypothetical protein A3B32_02970 [Candidatus Uhrbacteria bacterium RIFCSPLOWO2_01_FULL_53_9]OGL89504.1 MAG: hypothetical protein A3I45_00255 [Candidatus Uhrbacteria bacterium RIFCSPLOWO2_02_FULL_53_10]
MWMLVAILLGVLIASLVTGGVFRWHPEWAWMRPKRACMMCEVPRRGLDVVPILGDARSLWRCRACRAVLPWQYPAIELVIVGLTVFHVWRYQSGVWIPDEATELLFAWLARDILFTVALLLVFVYDLKYTLILPVYAIPSAIIAFALNLALGVPLSSLALGMAMLFLFFLLQHALSGGRLLGAGDVTMGLVLGAMLGFVDGIVAVMLAYILGAIVGVVLVATKWCGLHDRVPFGTFLAVAGFILLVWGDILTKIL